MFHSSTTTTTTTTKTTTTFHSNTNKDDPLLFNNSNLAKIENFSSKNLRQNSNLATFNGSSEEFLPSTTTTTTTTTTESINLLAATSFGNVTTTTTILNDNMSNIIKNDNNIFNADNCQFRQNFCGNNLPTYMNCQGEEFGRHHLFPTNKIESGEFGKILPDYSFIDYYNQPTTTTTNILTPNLFVDNQLQITPNISQLNLNEEENNFNIKLINYEKSSPKSHTNDILTTNSILINSPTTKKKNNNNLERIYQPQNDNNYQQLDIDQHYTVCSQFQELTNTNYCQKYTENGSPTTTQTTTTNFQNSIEKNPLTTTTKNCRKRLTKSKKSIKLSTTTTTATNSQKNRVFIKETTPKAIKLTEEICSAGYSKNSNDPNFLANLVKLQEADDVENQLLKKFFVEGQSQNCGFCDRPIHDEILLCVENKFFHNSCLKCSQCVMLMNDAAICFCKNNSLYCKACYVQKFQNKCASCEREIQSTDWVRKAHSFLYHLACFSCHHCKRQLSTGEQFSLQNNRLLCKQHYLELVQGDDVSIKKTKRVRTTFAEEQLAILQTHFQIDCNPDGSDLERIANLTGLSKRVTQVWFQNSRARQKKYSIVKKSDLNGISGNGSTFGGNDSLSTISGRTSSSNEEDDSIMISPTRTPNNDHDDEIMNFSTSITASHEDSSITSVLGSNLTTNV